MLPLFAFLDDAKQSISAVRAQLPARSRARSWSATSSAASSAGHSASGSSSRIAANAQADRPPGRGHHPRVHRRPDRLQRDGQALRPRRRRQGHARATPANKSAPTRAAHRIRVVTPPKVDQTPIETTVRVTVLAGTAVRARGSTTSSTTTRPRTLAELKEAITARKAKTKGKASCRSLFSSDPNLAPPRNDPKVDRRDPLGDRGGRPRRDLPGEPIVCLERGHSMLRDWSFQLAWRRWRTLAALEEMQGFQGFTLSASWRSWKAWRPWRPTEITR